MTKKGLIAGGLAALFIFLGTFLVGRLGNGEALALLEATFPTTRFMCSAAITASSTVLALMLTLLSFTSNTEQKLKNDYYNRIKQIALMDVIAFIGAIFLLMLINLPLQESEKLYPYYKVIYYINIGYSSLLGGILISIVIMLYESARDIILVVEPGKDAQHLIMQEDDDEEPQ